MGAVATMSRPDHRLAGFDADPALGGTAGGAGQGAGAGAELDDRAARRQVRGGGMLPVRPLAVEEPGGTSVIEAGARTVKRSEGEELETVTKRSGRQARLARMRLVA